ncbi:hypothetical protein MAPG_04023 [Magnaporthiopsis poae ATCC 64411]|uniref:Uncharacterized protein n=1 Tax=Magnaporthiopsis poae (strain ATCC 64411 / 73-15) TaxID=644358 RepID=A0A0C4DVL6_MAGP6|nr:hypothetical protein MAPG_04023 [Magnaporthiopsis poae ATCC 64411]
MIHLLKIQFLLTRTDTRPDSPADAASVRTKAKRHQPHLHARGTGLPTTSRSSRCQVTTAIPLSTSTDICRAMTTAAADQGLRINMSSRTRGTSRANCWTLARVTSGRRYGHDGGEGGVRSYVSMVSVRIVAVAVKRQMMSAGLTGTKVPPHARPDVVGLRRLRAQPHRLLGRPWQREGLPIPVEHGLAPRRLVFAGGAWKLRRFPTPKDWRQDGEQAQWT